MSSKILEKFKNKKKQDMLIYAKYLEEIITIENNTLWQKKQEFVNLAKGIIDYYVENYYFDNNINRKNPIEYSNDNINSILLSIIEYYKLNNVQDYIQSKKNETFLLAVILCTTAYVDIASNVVDGSYIDTKGNFKILLNHLAKTNILKIYRNDKVTINELFDEVKKCVNDDEKFFRYFEFQDIYYEYYDIVPEENMYELKLIYNVEGLDEFESKMVKGIRKKYIDKYLNVGYELLSVILLKENIKNKELDTYLISITESIMEKSNGLKALSDKIFQKNIKVLVDYKYYGIESIKNITNQGFEIVYKYDGVDVGELRDCYNATVIIDEEFRINNMDALYEIEQHNVKFINKNIMCKKITSKEMFNIKEEM